MKKYHCPESSCLFKTKRKFRLDEHIKNHMASYANPDNEIALGVFEKMARIIEKNTKIIRPVKKNFNYREKIWNLLAGGFYVIGSDFTHFDKQAEEQGFLDLVTHIYIYKGYDAFADLSEDEQKILRDWSNNFSSGSPKTMGCHISQAIASKELLNDGVKRGIIFENDCKFEYKVSNTVLFEMAEWCETNNPGYLALGTWDNPSTSYCGKIMKTFKSKDGLTGENIHIKNNQSHLAHSYIINVDTATKHYNTLDASIPRLDVIYKFKNSFLSFYYKSENIYRFGADAFFTGFIDQYAVYPAMTFQEFIGCNLYIRPRDTNPHQCKLCHFGSKNPNSYIKHVYNEHKEVFRDGVNYRLISFSIESKNYKCDKCIFGCNKLHYFKNHMKSHENSKLIL